MAWCQRGRNGVNSLLTALTREMSRAHTHTPSLRRPSIDPELLSVAPMMDVTDRHFRFMLRLLTRHTVLYTEMIVDNTLLFSGRAPAFLRFDAAEHPIVCQLGGSVPESVAAAAVLVERAGYDAINLNCGCPSPRVAGRGSFGAALMFEPETVRDIVAAVRRAVTIPISVKCRLGADKMDSYAAFANFLRVVASGGCSHFIVHARKALLRSSPKDNRSVPPLRYHWVQRAALEFPHLRIGVNGGVATLPDAAALMLLRRVVPPLPCAAAVASECAATQAAAAAAAAAAATATAAELSARLELGMEGEGGVTGAAFCAYSSGTAAALGCGAESAPFMHIDDTRIFPKNHLEQLALNVERGAVLPASFGAESHERGAAESSPTVAAADSELADAVSGNSPLPHAVLAPCTRASARVVSPAVGHVDAPSDCSAAGADALGDDASRDFRCGDACGAASLAAAAPTPSAPSAGSDGITYKYTFRNHPAAFPGVQALLASETHRNLLESVMVGRAAHSMPWAFADADRLFFGVPNPGYTRREVISLYLDYVDGLAASVPAEERNDGVGGMYGAATLARPLFNLFAGCRNGGRFRHALAVGVAPNSGLSVRAATEAALLAADLQAEVLDEHPPM